MITWITDHIAIGEYTDAINEKLLKKEKIDCVFSLRHEVTYVDPDPEWYDEMGIDFYKIPVGYFPQTTIKIELRTAAYMLEQLTKKYSRILVHCTAGMDRAPFVVVAFLAWVHTGEQYLANMEYWYSRVKRLRPQIIEHWEWV